MSNTLQQQLGNMTPDQAIGLMQQAMASMHGSRAGHMLLARAEEVITAAVRKGVEASPTDPAATTEVKELAAA
ncbi:hypothetical protein SH467x_000235 [Pirellulaceae bacterium SH467]